MHFGDRLTAAVRAKGSVAVIGIDPRVASLPPRLAREAAEGGSALTSALQAFGLGIIDAVQDLVPAVKPNIAFFEAHGLPGLQAYHRICEHARSKHLIVIGDVKRGDIGSTAAAYAQGLLQPAPPSGTDGLGPHDALTLNPYLGRDSLTPFTDLTGVAGQGVFILVKTSNPSSKDLQDLPLAEGGTVAEATAKLVAELGADRRGETGLSDIGAVVGATHPAELGHVRRLMPHAPLLLPGYGSQGGTARDVVDAFGEGASGAVVNASRSVIFAWQKQDSPDQWQDAARSAAARMNEDLISALSAAGKWDSATI